jgi:DNA-nicking Smr family endonuclease
MGFEEILDAWEESRMKKAPADREELERMLSHYPPKGSKETDREKEPRAGLAPDLRKLEPQKVLDLHGLSGREAEQALDDFIQEARSIGLQKVLIIHGKGHHSQGEPVLQGVVRRYLEKCPYTGAFGPAGRKHGGRGATWVLVRKAARKA